MIFSGRISSDTNPCKIALEELKPLNILITSSTDQQAEKLNLFDGDLATYAKATPRQFKNAKKATITMDLIKTYHVTSIYIYHMILTDSCGAWKKIHTCLQDNTKTLLTGCNGGKKDDSKSNSSVEVKAFRDRRNKSSPVYLDTLELESDEEYNFTLTTNFIGNRIAIDTDTDTDGIAISDIVLVGTPYG